jgi:nitrite reductase/ring-hydroxylating ferredoxin subunit
MPIDERAGDDGIDPLIVAPSREGLTGTAPASLYGPRAPRDQLTIPPDGRSPDEQPPWRRDFPIDWPVDQYVARRDFTKFLVLTSLAFAVGQVWIGLHDWWRGTPGALPRQRIASLDDVPIGGTVMFTYPGAHDGCILIRTGPADVVAYSQKCTHLSCAVIPRPSEGVIRCPCHEGLFDLASGRPIAGPPRRPLPRILTEIRDGAVWAVGIDVRTV